MCVCVCVTLHLFTGTIIQKIQEQFNVCTTNECRLWYWNRSCNTLNNVEDTLISALSIDEKEGMYVLQDLNNIKV